MNNDSQNWKIAPLLKTTENYFSEKKIETSRLDAEVLLAHVLNCERIKLYTDFDKILTEKELSEYRELVKRRASFEPTAYILGEKEFYSLTFKVDKSVLVPRPETENLVEEVIKFTEKYLPNSNEIKILDLGTGSGCIAVTLAANIKNAKIIASDISKAALHTAAINSVINKVDADIEFRQGSMFDPFEKEKFDLVVSNPPYISKDEKLMKDVADFEPPEALFADNNGLAFYKNICSSLKSYLNENGAVFFEVGDKQANTVCNFLNENGFKNCQVFKDNNNINRIVCAALFELETEKSESKTELTYEPIKEQISMEIEDNHNEVIDKNIETSLEYRNHKIQKDDEKINAMLDKYAEDTNECPD